MTINKPDRDPAKPLLDRVIAEASAKEPYKLTVYVPIEDRDALATYALKKRTNVSAIVRILIDDFIKALNNREEI